MLSKNIRTGKDNARRAFINERGREFEVTFLGANGSVIVQEPQIVDSHKEAVEEAEDFCAGTVTNVEKIVTLMNYSKAGPLIQAFVITAIEKYADAVIKGGPSACDSSLISGAAWVRCAEDAKQQLGD